MFIGKNNSQVLADERLRYEAESHNKEVELLSLKLYNQRLLIYGSLGLFGSECGCAYSASKQVED